MRRVAAAKTTMRRSLLFSILVLTALAAAPSALPAQDRPFSPGEIRALVERAIANQHRDDAALMEFERTERIQVRKSANDATPSEDKAYRVIPAGTGNARIPIEDHGRATDAEEYRKQLRDLEQALVRVLDPNSAKQKQDNAKFQKHVRDRAELVDTTRDAFRYTWLGRETRDGRTFVKLSAEPNPGYNAPSRTASLFSYVHATVWLDEASAHMARVEAEIIRDISFGGGVIGKLYRGGRFVLERTEVAPGIWLPTRYQYDFGGRKFLFGFETHELTLASNYRRIGPPKEALAAIRRELSAGSGAAAYQTNP
jgi:hypothetical protein